MKMKVLWVANSLLPEALALLKREKELKGTGSWVLAMATILKGCSEIDFYYVATTDLVKVVTVLKGENITYYAIPQGKGDCSYNKEYEMAYKEICKKIQPEVVHIHGTEYPHSLAALRAFGVERSVVSLQGLVSVIAPFYMGGISKKEALYNLTFHDLVRKTLMQQQKDMTKRGRYEQELLREAHYVIGRTSWDYAHTWAYNPNVVYFHGDEALRQEFYFGDVWNYESCTPHSIFASQGYYPLKGLHILIDAINIVKQHFPDVQLRVAGYDFTYSNGTFLDRFRVSTYGKLIKNKIAKYKLYDNIIFTGPLNADEMKKEYLDSNLFVCSSIIENSPNSLGEAQILGVPCLASFVGGVPDMMRGNEVYLYRFEDVELLARKICEVFERQANIENDIIRDVAIGRHNPQIILDKILEIYRTIINNSNNEK